MANIYNLGDRGSDRWLILAATFVWSVGALFKMLQLLLLFNMLGFCLVCWGYWPR